MIVVKVQGLKELQRDLRKSPEVIRKHIGAGISDSAEILRQNVRRKAPVFEGTLKKNIEKNVSRNDLSAEVFVAGSAKKYGYVQEYGRKPGKMPPPQALEKWARIKLGDSALAFPLARSIARKGTKERPFFKPGVKVSIPGINKVLDRAFKKAVEEI